MGVTFGWMNLGRPLSGLSFNCRKYPALKRRAIFIHPSGMNSAPDTVSCTQSRDQLRIAIENWSLVIEYLATQRFQPWQLYEMRN